MTALVTDVINPLIGIVLGPAKGLETATVAMGQAEILLGHFVSVVIDFLVIALVVIFGVKALGLDKKPA